MISDNRQVGAGESELTEEMIDAGCSVEWVQDFQGEFQGFEPEHDQIMRKHVRDLWIAMARARPHSAS